MENNQETKTVTQTESSNEKNTEETVTQTDNKTEEEPKTFTQDEVNKLLAKERKKLPPKEEMNEFYSWKESQKSEAQKQSEFNQKLTDTTNENISLKHENLVLKSNVNPEDADYVVFKVSKMEGDFEDNLKDFLKENPKYLINSNDYTKNVESASGTSVTKISDSDESGVTAILKRKHPELFN